MSPLYRSRGPIRWVSTVEASVTGAGGTGVQAIQTAGAFDTIPGGTLRDNDRVRFQAEFEVTKDAATNVIPNIYWGGVAGGVALFNTGAVLASATGLVIQLRSELTIRTSGASPVWGYFSEWMSSTNNTYEDMKKAYDLTSVPTNADIVVEASAQVTGAVTANDRVKLRNFRREIIRSGY